MESELNLATKKFDNVRYIELIVLFVFMPLGMWSELIPRNPILMLNIFFVFALIIAKNEKINLKCDFRLIFKKFFIFSIPIIIFSYFFLGDDFLILVKERPLMWILISILYPLLSVISQEFLYRHFFWIRYGSLFKNQNYLVATNCLLFGLAHIVMNNIWALIIGVIGGFIFAKTYSKDRSFLAVFIEHSLYGILLFTLGYGKFLYHRAN